MSSLRLPMRHRIARLVANANRKSQRNPSDFPITKKLKIITPHIGIISTASSSRRSSQTSTPWKRSIISIKSTAIWRIWILWFNTSRRRRLGSRMEESGKQKELCMRRRMRKIKKMRTMKTMRMMRITRTVRRMQRRRKSRKRRKKRKRRKQQF